MHIKSLNMLAQLCDYKLQRWIISIAYFAIACCYGTTSFVLFHIVVFTACPGWILTPRAENISCWFGSGRLLFLTWTVLPFLHSIDTVTLHWVERIFRILDQLLWIPICCNLKRIAWTRWYARTVINRCPETRFAIWWWTGRRPSSDFSERNTASRSVSMVYVFHNVDSSHPVWLVRRQYTPGTECSPYRIRFCCLPVSRDCRLSLPNIRKLSQWPRVWYLGAQYRACILDPSGSRLPLPGLPADFTTDLPTRLWSGGTCATCRHAPTG